MWNANRNVHNTPCSLASTRATCSRVCENKNEKLGREYGLFSSSSALFEMRCNHVSVIVLLLGTRSVIIHTTADVACWSSVLDHRCLAQFLFFFYMPPQIDFVLFGHSAKLFIADMLWCVCGSKYVGPKNYFYHNCVKLMSLFMCFYGMFLFFYFPIWCETHFCSPMM